MHNFPAIDVLDCVQSPVFVLGTNHANRVIYTGVNRAACELLSASKDDIVGKTAVSLFGEEHGKPVYGRHVMAMCTGLPAAYDIAVAFSGRPLLLHTQLMPLRNREGDVVNILGTTQQMSSAYAQRDSQYQSHCVLDEAEQFIALAAHDLRAPIRNFTSIVDMLSESVDEPSAEQRSLVSLAQNLAETSYDNIDDIVTYAAASSVNHSFDEFNLAEVGRAVLVSIDPLCQHHLSCEDRWLYGDKLALELILRTLFSQVIKNNASTTVSVQVHVEPVSDTRFRVVYADTGVGFDDVDINHQNDTEFILKGGYGLSSIRRIVVERNGEFAIGNAQGDGGRHARFSLPGQVLFYPEQAVG
ncbi:MAG: PAS domain-containing protein [Pseudomonadota bacterium]